MNGVSSLLSRIKMALYGWADFPQGARILILSSYQAELAEADFFYGTEVVFQDIAAATAPDWAARNAASFDFVLASSDVEVLECPQAYFPEVSLCLVFVCKGIRQFVGAGLHVVGML